MDQKLLVKSVSAATDVFSMMLGLQIMPGEAH